MICPIKTDPNWIALEKAQPDLAYYLWNEYEGEVPAEYYTSNLPDIRVEENIASFYNSNIELQSIGSLLDYQKHLNTIYPSYITEYRGDTFGMNSFYYSERSEEKAKKGIVHKLGPGVYTTSSLSNAEEFAKDNKGQAYSVLVNNNGILKYNTLMDFYEDVGNYFSLDIMPTSDMIDIFTKYQQSLGKSITVEEINETNSPVENVYILGTNEDLTKFKNFVKGNTSPLDIDIENCNLPS